jgi:GH25 family lysozyme M1 (1,4-beta-N-acetylmuramidase)
MSLNGIDIASYQSKIQPSKLTTTDFVIVKFTQGTTYLNPYVKTQYSMSKKADKLSTVI